MTDPLLADFIFVAAGRVKVELTFIR